MEPIFREHMTSDRAQAELADAKQLARSARVCLLCFEQDPMRCHRRFVAEMVSAETGQSDRAPARATLELTSPVLRRRTARGNFRDVHWRNLAPTAGSP